MSAQKADDPLSSSSTIFHWLSSSTTMFQEISDTPSLDAQLILGCAMGISRTQLLAKKQDAPIADLDALANAHKMRDLRIKGYPIAYLLGYQEFFGYQFFVCPGVLIPRADSECLIEAVLTHFPSEKNYKIHDVGTGPGTLGLTLAKHYPHSQVTCSDISPVSQKLFTKNRIALDIHNATFKRENLLSGSQDVYDIIVANLPYLTPEETKHKHKLENWKEPTLALNGKGKDGLFLIKKLIQQAQHRCQSIYLEADPRQMPAITKTLTKYQFHQIRTYPDLTGQIRVISAESRS